METAGDFGRVPAAAMARERGDSHTIALDMLDLKAASQAYLSADEGQSDN